MVVPNVIVINGFVHLRLGLKVHEVVVDEVVGVSISLETASSDSRASV
jgi:hypothetical protein